MKRFVRNDNRLYYMTKWQSTFLCIMTDYRKVTKLLQKGYKSYKIVMSISLWRSTGTHRTGAGICPQWRSVSVYTSKGAAFGELGAAFGGVGSCVLRELRFKGSYDSKGAMFKRSVAAVGATTLDY